jgi:hypothetical protein
MKAFAAVVSGRAEFLVYKGTMRRYAPKDSVGPVSRGCYLVINLSTNEVGFLTYYSLKGKKHQFRSDPVTVHPFVETRVDGKTVDTFSYAQFQDFGSGTYENQSLFLHGLPATVIVGASNATDQQPKTLAGNYSLDAVGIGSRYEESTFTLSFDQVHTVAANVVVHTTTTEMDFISALLGGLGYN